jgi:hypothetical protein
MKEVDPPIGEAGFIAILENKAKLQRKLVETEIMPEWAKGMGGWLTVNPWRVIVPLSLLGYLMFRMVGGNSLREFVLGLFGGFA